MNFFTQLRNIEKFHALDRNNDFNIKNFQKLLDENDIDLDTTDKEMLLNKLNISYVHFLNILKITKAFDEYLIIAKLSMYRLIKEIYIELVWK